jgi:predicted aconitase
MLELMSSLAGKVPYFGLITDAGRQATWTVEVKCKNLPEAQLLGSAIGMKVMEEVPYIIGLDKFLGSEINATVKGYLKDMGAATASNGAVGLYHVDNLTPEAKELGKKLINKDAKTYVIDDAEIERVYKSYPIMWKKANVKPKICFIGCPHLTLLQLNEWTEKLEVSLKASGRNKVAVKTVMSSAPDTLEVFKKSENFNKLKAMGVYISALCPLMYTSNPIAAAKPIITNSNKFRTYSMARYYPDAEILSILSGKEVK